MTDVTSNDNDVNSLIAKYANSSSSGKMNNNFP